MTTGRGARGISHPKTRILICLYAIHGAATSK